MSKSNKHQSSSGSYVLKTCQTCFHAKIRCDKSRDSELCDRCLRLGKECVFNPARRRPKVSRQRPNETLEVRTRSSRVSKSRVNSQNSSSAPTPKRLVDVINRDASLDPFERGILSLETASTLIDWFKTKMTPHFPFVVLSKDLSVDELSRQRPCAYLAALAAASHSELHTQQALGSLFNQVIAARMIEGNIADIDLLQGLLIHLAWAHYQTRPKRYTQHLHLATSIVCDLRLDRPRRPEVWSVDGSKDKNEPDWSPEEMRALVGVYYLSSSSSLILQKSRHFYFTPYISTCCEYLAHQNQHPTDKHLACIVNLQKLTEQVEEITGRTSNIGDGAQFEAEIQQIAQKCAEVKSTLPFSLSESPPLFLQFHMLELFLSQSSPQGTSFGLDKFQDNQNRSEHQASLMSWLSASISAARSLISVVLVLPQGEEGAMSNIGWIIIYCGLSLAVRLDLIAANRGIAEFTQHLRQFLDMPHTLRQVVLRLEAAAGLDSGTAAGDHGPFHGFAKRVRRLEEWYFARIDQQVAEPTTTATLQVTDQLTMAMGTDSIPGVDLMISQDAWAGSSDWYHGSELDMGTFLFMDPVDFSGVFVL
ncbi:hypothetical protein BKA56DRAFT_590215 [Ilyonectria sp. MPI-CAGE-AT-0026]|nr:hypothetical protein BKA56DRAFT_590215 [Ilyonectria sp. MPI-CAGE-AT-0026]